MGFFLFIILHIFTISGQFSYVTNQRCITVVELCINKGFPSCFNVYIACQTGARAEFKDRGRRDAGDGGGVRGLKSLGVRELTYKLAFLACTVVPCNKRVSCRTLQ